MKKIFLYSLAFVFMTLSCTKDNDVAKKVAVVNAIELSAKTLTLVKGTVKKINYTVLPEEATDKIITWTSSDESKVIVNDKGVVRAIDLGTAIITAKSTNGISSVCNVGVIVDPYIINEIKLSSEKTEIYTGETLSILATILPESAKASKLSWSSSDNEVGTVDFNGNLHSKSAGTVTVTATSEEGVTASIEITVKSSTNKKGFRISPRITLSKKYPTKVEIHMQYFTKADEDVKIISWESSDASKVDIYKNDKGQVSDRWGDPSNEPGLVLKDAAIHGDKITITATREDGLKSDCIVTVNTDENYVRAIGMWGDTELTAYIGVDKALVIDANNSKSDDFNKDLLFFSSDNTILTVSEDKIIHPLRVGAATITTFSVDHGKFFQCVVIVKDPNED